MRELWEKVHKDVNGLIPEHLRKHLINTFSIDKEIERLGEGFELIQKTGLQVEFEVGLFAHWIKLMIVFDRETKNCFDLMEIKRKRYGNRPIELTGHIGILVRQIAKLCRLHNMVTGDLDGDDETLEDTKMDIFNYCVIAFEFCSNLPWFMEMAAKSLTRELEDERR